MPHAKNNEFSSQMPETKRIVRSAVPASAHGKRLDDYLAERFTYRSLEKWRERIQNGSILLDDHPATPDIVLRNGQTVSMNLSPEEAQEPPVNTAYSILLDTPQFLAVGKPPNLPVHPSGRYFNHTLQRLLAGVYGHLHPVNRIDRETSGIVLFAKSSEYAAELAELFARGRVSKYYLAVVHGHFPDSLDAQGFLSRDIASPITKKRRFTTDLPDIPSETCHTRFQCLRRSDQFSLLKCQLFTGRLHQIRATLCSLGFPIVGDKMYGPDESLFLRFIHNELTDADRKTLVLPRQALHAAELSFLSPFSDTQIVLTAPMPDDFSRLFPPIH